MNKQNMIFRKSIFKKIASLVVINFLVSSTALSQDPTIYNPSTVFINQVTYQNGYIDYFFQVALFNLIGNETTFTESNFNPFDKIVGISGTSPVETQPGIQMSVTASSVTTSYPPINSGVVELDTVVPGTIPATSNIPTYYNFLGPTYNRGTTSVSTPENALVVQGNQGFTVTNQNITAFNDLGFMYDTFGATNSMTRGVFGLFKDIVNNSGDSVNLTVMFPSDKPFIPTSTPGNVDIMFIGSTPANNEPSVKNLSFMISFIVGDTSTTPARINVTGGATNFTTTTTQGSPLLVTPSPIPIYPAGDLVYNGHPPQGPQNSGRSLCVVGVSSSDKNLHLSAGTSYSGMIINPDISNPGAFYLSGIGVLLKSSSGKSFSSIWGF